MAEAFCGMRYGLTSVDNFYLCADWVPAAPVYIVHVGMACRTCISFGHCAVPSASVFILNHAWIKPPLAIQDSLSPFDNPCAALSRKLCQLAEMGSILVPLPSL